MVARISKHIATLATAGLASAGAACSPFEGTEPVQASGPADSGLPATPEPALPTADGGPEAGGAAVRPAGALVVFVSSPAAYTTVEGADARCNTDAASMSVPGRFVAWLSDARTSGSGRLARTPGPWVRVDGKPVAASLTALLSTATTPLQNPITKLDGTTTSSPVYTFTRANGTTGALCASPTVGIANAVGPTWTDGNAVSTTPSCSDALPVYCFQVE